MKIQEAFDECVKRIHEQGEPGTNPETGSCAYHGETGHKCAVGIMLPDDILRELMGTSFAEGGVVDILECSSAEPLKYRELSDRCYQALQIDGDTVGFWERMQGAHDSAAMEGYAGGRVNHTGPAFIKRFDERARTVAVELGLKWSES